MLTHDPGVDRHVHEIDHSLIFADVLLKPRDEPLAEILACKRPALPRLCWVSVPDEVLGCGHLYQGRFKSFPIQRDEHFLTVCRYVERNALTAKVVERAEAWRWNSLWARQEGGAELKALLNEWPVDRPRKWVELVNEVMTARKQEAARTSIARNRPFGSPAWQRATAGRLGLLHALGSEGRPRKAAKDVKHRDNCYSPFRRLVGIIY